LISIIAVIVGIIFVIFKHDALPVILVVIPGLIAIIAATAALTISLTFRQNRLHPGEVYIGKSGALLGRASSLLEIADRLICKLPFLSGESAGNQINIFVAVQGITGGIQCPVSRSRKAEKKPKQVLAQLKGEKN